LDDFVTQQTFEKIESNSVSDKKFFRFLQHCSLREGRWGETTGMIQWHLNSLSPIKKTYCSAPFPEDGIHW